jgi:hypothetical protein
LDILAIPFNVEETYGVKSQVKVRGTINDIPFKSSLMPNGDGTHFMVVNKSIHDAAWVSSGDMVHIVMEQDKDIREVAVPEDLKNALERDDSAKENFEQLSYSHKKEYVDWIEQAKKEETRVKRVEAALLKLKERKALKK